MIKVNSYAILANFPFGDFCLAEAYKLKLINCFDFVSEVIIRPVNVATVLLQKNLNSNGG